MGTPPVIAPPDEARRVAKLENEFFLVSLKHGSRTPHRHCEARGSSWQKVTGARKNERAIARWTAFGFANQGREYSWRDPALDSHVYGHIRVLCGLLRRHPAFEKGLTAPMTIDES